MQESDSTSPPVAPSGGEIEIHRGASLSNATASGWQGESPRSRGFFGFLTLFLLCLAVAVAVQLLATTVEGFLIIAPTLAMVAGGLALVFLAGAAGLRWSRRVSEIKSAQPLCTWREFVDRGERDAIPRLIRRVLTKEEAERLSQDRDAFYRYLLEDLPSQVVHRRHELLAECYENEWWRFRLGVSRYQEEIEALIHHGPQCPALGVTGWLGRLERLPKTVDKYTHDEALFLRMMRAYFFQIVRQYNRKQSVYDDLEEGTAPHPADADEESTASVAVEIDDLLDAECYAYFEYGRGEYAMFMRVYFAEHPDVEPNEVNFRRVLRENLAAFQRKKTVLARIDAKYGDKPGVAELNAARARRRAKAAGR